MIDDPESQEPDEISEADLNYLRDLQDAACSLIYHLQAAKDEAVIRNRYEFINDLGRAWILTEQMQNILFQWMEGHIPQFDANGDVVYCLLGKDMVYRKIEPDYRDNV